jgi:superfamily II DNA or RNA helicase
MLNFRKARQTFSPSILKDGSKLYGDEMVSSAVIVELDEETLRFSGRVQGNYENDYECELEIGRFDSEVVDSNCDCPYSYDCQHLAALSFYLEEHLNEVLVNYSKEAGIDTDLIQEPEEVEGGLEKTGLFHESLQSAVDRAVENQERKFEQEELEEYISSSQLLAMSPFFMPFQRLQADQAELALVFQSEFDQNTTEVQLALRLPFRSKPLHIPDIKEFTEAIRYQEPLYISSKKYFFTDKSFDVNSRRVLSLVTDHARFFEKSKDRSQRVACIDNEDFGQMLSNLHEELIETGVGRSYKESVLCVMPCLYMGSLENSLHYSTSLSSLRFALEYLEAPAPKLFIKPVLVIDQQEVKVEECRVFECPDPGVIHNQVYYRFPEHLKRVHLQQLDSLRNMTIPEPLFGTFVENALPELSRFGSVANPELAERFVTLPYVDSLEGRCEVSYLDGELDVCLYFIYEDLEIPAAPARLSSEHLKGFCTHQGVVARNLTEEKQLIDSLFQGFIYNEENGVFEAKVAKTIVEFMTEIVPLYQHKIEFNCPVNLKEQFIYDETQFSLKLKESSTIDTYEVSLEVNGHLEGVSMASLLECLAAKKTYLELENEKVETRRGRKAKKGTKLPKVLVLDLENLAPIVMLFDELGIEQVKSHKIKRPLWSLVNVQPDLLKELPLKFSMTRKLTAIRQQMLGMQEMDHSSVPENVNATLRGYQTEGVYWLERLRNMHLGGILADDMGLGKTLQAIVAITQLKMVNPNSISLVICPNSLLLNWKEEIFKFNPDLTSLVVDGTPVQRKKLLKKAGDYDVLITSYTLLQKDIEIYEKLPLAYSILDEAQNIKNRTTRNARSVKMLNASYKLILTGTPIENSLEELWSLFDFLMPGLLGSYERFVEKYVRQSSLENKMEHLKRKVAPFILRRMKEDVLKDLPPVSEIIYHCGLSPLQQELYKSYADSAREELTRLVAKEGFDRVRIHVLATLTRLKQICCHPAIFAKEKAEAGDSAKFDMLVDLLQSLIEGGHKTVVFSQYTRMLHILREDFEERGIHYAYLDGSSKDRMSIVKRFNEDASIPVFLVSLKAGGVGLNLVGADTVIHYDMWWNPAVENQATDRVHRIGQKKSVSSYKFVTLGTIEEKIVELQNRKKGLVKKIISEDDDVINKLTWDEVLELLKV